MNLNSTSEGLSPPSDRKNDIKILSGLVITTFVIYGFIGSCLGLFIEPVRAYFNVSIGEASRIPSIYFFSMAFAALGCGWLLDRFTPRFVMGIGVTMIITSLLAGSFANSFMMLLVAFSGTGIGVSLTAGAPVQYVVTRYLRMGMASALGFILGGGSLGASIIPILVQWIISEFGWSMAIRVMAVVVGIAMITVLILVIPGVRPHVKSDEKSSDSPKTPKDLKQQKRIMMGAFLLIVVMQILFHSNVMAVFVHLMPLLAAAGYPSSKAVLIYCGVIAVGAVGPLALGWLANRFGRIPTMVFAMMVHVASISLLLLIGRDGALAYAGIAIFMLFWGFSGNILPQFVPILVRQTVPTERLGFFLGISAFMSQICGAIGPLSMGALVDYFGRYQEVLEISAVIAFMGIIPLLVLRSKFSYR